VQALTEIGCAGINRESH